QYNLYQIGKGMYLCEGNYPQGRGGCLPPANGRFPSQSGPDGSFFYHLLPFIEEKGLYDNPADVPVKWYIAPGDPRNSGKDSTISYATNGVVFRAEEVRTPNSFYGRTFSII